MKVARAERRRRAARARSVRGGVRGNVRGGGGGGHSGGGGRSGGSGRGGSGNGGGGRSVREFVQGPVAPAAIARFAPLHVTITTRPASLPSPGVRSGARQSRTGSPGGPLRPWGGGHSTHWAVGRDAQSPWGPSFVVPPAWAQPFRVPTTFEPTPQLTPPATQQSLSPPPPPLPPPASEAGSIEGSLRAQLAEQAAELAERSAAIAELVRRNEELSLLAPSGAGGGWEPGVGADAVFDRLSVSGVSETRLLKRQ